MAGCPHRALPLCADKLTTACVRLLSSPQASEVEETLKRLQSHRGVEGVIIMDANGLAIRSTFSEELSQQYCEMFSELCIAARNSVRTLDPENDLTFMRVRSHKHEIMVAPAKDYVLLVVQNPNVDEELA